MRPEDAHLEFSLGGQSQHDLAATSSHGLLFTASLLRSWRGDDTLLCAKTAHSKPPHGTHVLLLPIVSKILGRELGLCNFYPAFFFFLLSTPQNFSFPVASALLAKPLFPGGVPWESGRGPSPQFIQPACSCLCLEPAVDQQESLSCPSGS